MGVSKEHRSGKTSRTVIVAIHDRAPRDKTCDYLRDAGFMVVPAPTCQFALTACRSAAMDPVLVVEIRLPDMWGLDLAREAAQFHFKTLVICISEKELRKECQEEMSQRGWIWLKDGSPESILEAIHQVMAPSPRRQKTSHAVTGISSVETQSRNFG